MISEENANGVLLLPDSRTKVKRNVVRIGMMNWVPIFCANCGNSGGHVPEENCTFAFYQCVDCSEKYPNIEGTYSVPDEVFFQKVLEEQLEKYSRLLTNEELITLLANENSSLSKLAKDKPTFKSMT